MRGRIDRSESLLWQGHFLVHLPYSFGVAFLYRLSYKSFRNTQPSDFLS
jgi:hypothetical protein